MIEIPARDDLVAPIEFLCTLHISVSPGHFGFSRYNLGARLRGVRQDGVDLGARLLEPTARRDELRARRLHRRFGQLDACRGLLYTSIGGSVGQLHAAPGGLLFGDRRLQDSTGLREPRRIITGIDLEQQVTLVHLLVVGDIYP